MAGIDIVIVNWNSRHFLAGCMQALQQAYETAPGIIASVCVVDNGSVDDSLACVEHTDLPLHVVRNHDNRGFATACNQGSLAGTAPYILFLNPDTAVTAAALSVAAAYMEQSANASVGICGVQLLDEQGKVARSCARFPTPGMFANAALGLDRLFPQRFRRARMAEWDHGQTRRVDQVIGAFFLIRRPLFAKLGRFDERYFVYYEEVDLTYRASQAGYASVFLADVQAWHRGGGTSESIKARRLYYSLRSRLLYAFKHFKPAGAVAVALVTLCLEPASRVAHALLRGSPRNAAETLQGYAFLWAWLPRYLFRGTTR